EDRRNLEPIGCRNAFLAVRLGTRHLTTQRSGPRTQAMLLRIQHETKLTYSVPVSETVFEVRMAPPSDEEQTNLGYHLRTIPSAPGTVYRDGFGNRVDLFNILASYQELIIRATSIVRTHRGTSPQSRAGAIDWHPDRDEFRAVETLEYLQPSPLVRRSPRLD